MADNSLASWASFLFELRGKTAQVFPTECPFLAEISGVGYDGTVNNNRILTGGNREMYSGASIRHTLVLAQLPAGGFVSETGTWNVPQALNTKKVNLNLTRLVQPFSVTVDLERDSISRDSASSVEQLTDQARIALAKLENIALLGDGTGKVSDISSGAGSPGLTITISATGDKNMDILLPGTVWDILTKATGADPGNGKRRIINTVTDSSTTQSLVFDTAAQASDGGSGNITWSTNEGIYIPGSWSNGTAGTGSGPGETVAAGLELQAAITGTFETLNKATTQQWQGTDGRGGDTSVLPLSDQMLDAAVRRGRRAAIGSWDFAIGDPAAIDLWKQGKYSQGRYDLATNTLQSGFRALIYEGADKPLPILKDPVAKKAGLRFYDKSSVQLYGDKMGPDFLEDDGAMFRRFARALPKEAELLDRFQYGVIKCNTIVFLNNLQVAA
jgi:hypothetical protein